jgi:glycosyltransferase involved in cell wall biosynthesis
MIPPAAGVHLPLEKISRAFDAPRLESRTSAWIEHIPFAWVLVDLLRPTSIVELGTHAGDSYCAFCQAVDTLGLVTRCTAVDTWKGDSQAGRYGPHVLQELRAHHDPLYGRFSRLVQASFDEAAGQFADGSIDLLHVDGMHTYEAVRHDVDVWRPKLSRRGVLLLHDTQVRGSDFGVWRVWEELVERGAGGGGHFEFTHGYGLGVLAMGAEVAEGVAAFLAWAGENAELARGFFAALGNRLLLARGLRQLTPLIEAQYQSLAALAVHARHSGLPPAPAAVEALGRQGDLKAWLDQWCDVLARQNDMLGRCSPGRLLDGRVHGAVAHAEAQPSADLAGPAASGRKTYTVSVIIPTQNAGSRFGEVLDGLQRQSTQGVNGPMELIVVDSGSTDGTARRAREAGARVMAVEAEAYNHGGTRNRAIEQSQGEVIVLLSQDAVPADDYLLSHLVAYFADPQVAGVYARQIPRPEHNVLIAREVRQWLSGSPERRLSHITERKAYAALTPEQRYHFCLFDNVGSAIRRVVWREIPFAAADFGEDLEWSRRVLEAGWKIGYEPAAMVLHSHDLGVGETYRRTRQCHALLCRLFDLRYCATRREVLRYTVENSVHDLAYLWWHQPGLMQKIALSFKVPCLRGADFLGRYRGVRDQQQRLGQERP